MRILTVLIALCLPMQTLAETIIMASTTSTQNSGLLDAILPAFTVETGIKVNVVAVGTGQALRIARNGDADILLVHHRPSEDAFVAEGFGIERHDVMYNDFVIVGPANDPAGVADVQTASEAMTRIADAGALFASRGDDSGTHKKEQELWLSSGHSPDGDWYRETGSGMGTTLNIAIAMDAYALTDRGTWITFGNKGNHKVLMAGDSALFNPYGIIAVSPQMHPHVKAKAAQKLVDWLISDTGQEAIGAFLIDGRQAFCPNALGFAQKRNEANKRCPVDQQSRRP